MKDDERWELAKKQLREDIVKVNKAIQDFNLIAPGLSRQVCQLVFARELERAERVVDSPTTDAVDSDASTQSSASTDSTTLKSGNPEFNTGGFRSLLGAMSIRKEKDNE